MFFSLFFKFYFQLEDNCFTILWCTTIHQHESIIGIHMSPPSWTSLPPPSPFHHSRLSQSSGFGFPVSYSKFPLAILFTYGHVYILILLSQVIPPSSFPTVTISLFSMFVSPLLSCKSRIINIIFLATIYMCFIWYLSFLFTSLCSRFIHFIRTDSNTLLSIAK